MSAGEYIKLKVGTTGTAINIKISGATPALTQKFEIINSINAAVGTTIAQPFDVDRIIFTAPTVGATSQLTLSVPDSPRTDATPILVPSTLVINGASVASGSFVVTVTSTEGLAPGMGVTSAGNLSPGTVIADILTTSTFLVNQVAIATTGSATLTVTLNGYGPAVYNGVAATVYQEGSAFDYVVDYTLGTIITKHRFPSHQF